MLSKSWKTHGIQDFYKHEMSTVLTCFLTQNANFFATRTCSLEIMAKSWSSCLTELQP